jgi:hypothetical protein
MHKLIIKELKFNVICHIEKRQKSQPSSSLIMHNKTYNKSCRKFNQLAPLSYHKKVIL